MISEFHEAMLVKYGENIDCVPSTWEYTPKIRKTNSLVVGVGINDVEFTVNKTLANGGRLVYKPYALWHGLLVRCYDRNFHTRNPKYIGVTVCDECKLLSNFTIWCLSNYRAGTSLDKDLLIKDNTIYSPTNCVFVPTNINNFLSMAKHSSDLPYGVCKHGNSYQASIGSGITAKSIYLGRFNTPEEAHRAWQEEKLKQAIKFNLPCLTRVIDQLQNDLFNNIETISL